MQMMDVLTVLKNRIAALPGIATCKIGLEDNLTPDDYPMVRIVPSRVEPSANGTRLKMELLIYFGAPVQPFDDTPDAGGRVRMEKLYAALFDIEAALRALPRNGDGFAYRYRDTITDEDRLDTYKIMAVRAEVEG
jgi:hypothetical protein